MKTTRHSLLAKGLMVLLSLLVLVFAFTYTWFRDPSAPVTASGLSLSVNSPSTDFEYAIGFSTSQTGNHYKHTQFTNEITTDLDLEDLVIYDPDDPQGTFHNKHVNLLYDYTPIDVTGDGYTLVRPAMNYGNWDINTASTNYSQAEANVQYVSFDMIFRSQSPTATVKLDSGSYAKGNCETYAGDGNLLNANVVSEGENISNFNAKTSESASSYKYGPFSRDAIVGAVRVAFLKYADSDELTANDIVNEDLNEFNPTPALVWIPRPDLFLNNGATTSNQLQKDGLTEGWTLDTNVSGTKSLISKAQINPAYSTYQHQYYNIFEDRDQGVSAEIKTYDAAIPSVLDSQATGNKVTFGQQQNLVTLSYINDDNNDGEPDDGYYYGKVRVRIWLEGTDSESRRALAGGKFSVGFHITA